MKFDSILITLLISAPYLIALLHGDPDFDETLNSLILQTANGLLLTKLYSFYRGSKNPGVQGQHELLTSDQINKPILHTILNLFSKDRHVPRSDSNEHPV